MRRRNRSLPCQSVWAKVHATPCSVLIAGLALRSANAVRFDHESLAFLRAVMDTTPEVQSGPSPDLQEPSFYENRTHRMSGAEQETRVQGAAAFLQGVHSDVFGSGGGGTRSALRKAIVSGKESCRSCLLSGRIFCLSTRACVRGGQHESECVTELDAVEGDAGNCMSQDLIDLTRRAIQLRVDEDTKNDVGMMERVIGGAQRRLVKLRSQQTRGLLQRNKADSRANAVCRTCVARGQVFCISTGTCHKSCSVVEDAVPGPEFKDCNSPVAEIRFAIEQKILIDTARAVNKVETLIGGGTTWLLTQAAAPVQ
eukprot:TRINITY_DN22039_c0_g1_i1.p1 TRINITY_DN22039_c0_g1~~TRINITY_DN22039_c0_g1_i1.p1  ORF type:complete len:312 (+),score=34.00 TRINITY_DN22039_c0_g1_i1:111-1046(+)